MKRYIQSLWTWVDGMIVALAVFLLTTSILAPFYCALIGIAAGVIGAVIVAAVFANTDKKFDPIVEKYAKNNAVVNEPVKVLGIKGQKTSMPARLVLTQSGTVMILLHGEGYRFSLDEDHSFIYVAKEHRMLLAKNGCDVQLTSGKMLSNLGYISLAIEKQGFRIERRDHAPY